MKKSLLLIVGIAILTLESLAWTSVNKSLDIEKNTKDVYELADSAGQLSCIVS